MIAQREVNFYAGSKLKKMIFSEKTEMKGDEERKVSNCQCPFASFGKTGNKILWYAVIHATLQYSINKTEILLTKVTNDQFIPLL